MARKTVSMLTEVMAKEGIEFSPYASEKCIHCPFFNVCIGNLRPGARYRVVKVRQHKNRCPLLSEEMYVVEVEELPVKLIIPSAMAVEGMTITYRRTGKCNEDEARKHDAHCNPTYILDGEKAVIRRVIAKLPNGLAVVEAEIVDQPKRELWMRVFPESATRQSRQRSGKMQRSPRRRGTRRRPPRKPRRSRRPPPSSQAS